MFWFHEIQSNVCLLTAADTTIIHIAKTPSRISQSYFSNLAFYNGLK